MITLHSLKGTKRSKTHRVGRGHGSGSGTYAGRGIKGQRARTGGSGGLKLMGLKQSILKLQKQKGMKSIHDKFSILNIQDIEKNFAEGQKIGLKNAIKAGLIPKNAFGLKVLGKAAMTKKFIVFADAVSRQAKAALEKAGGKVILNKKQITKATKKAVKVKKENKK